MAPIPGVVVCCFVWEIYGVLLCCCDFSYDIQGIQFEGGVGILSARVSKGLRDEPLRDPTQILVSSFACDVLFKSIVGFSKGLGGRIKCVKGKIRRVLGMLFRMDME